MKNSHDHSQAMVALKQYIDPMLVVAVTFLLGLGVVMIASASLVPGEEIGDSFYYLKRQLSFIGLGLIAAYICYQVPLRVWARIKTPLFFIAFILLASVWIPGLGISSHGARRWIDLGSFVMQVSEPAKLLFALYIAGYIVRHGDAIRENLLALAKPIGLLVCLVVLLLSEPDLGAAVVLSLMVIGMLFLAGIKLSWFALLLSSLASAFVLLSYYSTYRWERITGFLDPWADPYNTGYQLTQSLIAIGSGSFVGVGLGGSAQKLSNLPEAQNDFLFAILAEELGLVGVLIVLALYVLVVWRGFIIGIRAEDAGQRYAAFIAYSVSLWIGLQAFINIGVNMGVLPTKGLILPFMSSGGSSMIVACVSIALLLRAHKETTGLAVTTIRNDIVREYQV